MIRTKPYIRKRKRVGLLCLTLFSVFFSTTLSAQTVDTIGRRGPIARTVTNTSTATAQQPQEKVHSPNRALIYSAVLPGLGQVYNHQAWKIPIIYAALGGMGYYTYYNYTEMKSYKDEYLYRVNHNDTPRDADMAITPTSNIYNMYETYNKSFQLSVILSVAVYGLNLLDAYVFGHLFDFQIDDNLSLQMSPELMPTFCSGLALGNSFSFIPAASIRIRF